MAGPHASSEDGPAFFKVFLPIHSSIHMSIPKAFVNKLNAALPEKAILKDETGRSWHVSLERIGKDLCFGIGWELFVQEGHCRHGWDWKRKVKQEREEDNGNWNDVAQTHSGGITRVHKRKRGIEIGKSGPSEGNGGSKRSKRAIKNLEQLRVQGTLNPVSPWTNQYVLTNITATCRYGVSLSSQFEREMLLSINQNNKCPVKMNLRLDGRCALSAAGWKDFLMKNSIKGGDKCVLEAVVGASNFCEEIHVQVIHGVA